VDHWTHRDLQGSVVDRWRRDVRTSYASPPVVCIASNVRDWGWLAEMDNCRGRNSSERCPQGNPTRTSSDQFDTSPVLRRLQAQYATGAATGNVCPPEPSTDRRSELSFRGACEIAAVLMQQARMMNYRRVDAAGRL
jgi:hypothetical protein